MMRKREEKRDVMKDEMECNDIIMKDMKKKSYK